MADAGLKDFATREQLRREDVVALHRSFSEFKRLSNGNREVEAIGETRSTVSLPLSQIDKILSIVEGDMPSKEGQSREIPTSDARYKVTKRGDGIAVELSLPLRRGVETVYVPAGTVTVGREQVSGSVTGVILERTNALGQDAREQHGMNFSYSHDQLTGTAFDETVTLVDPDFLKVQTVRTTAPFTISRNSGSINISRGQSAQTQSTDKYL